MENPAGEEEVAPPPGPCPWLVFDNGDGYKRQTFCCNITGPSSVMTYPKRIPILQNKKVVSCSYGMLVLYDVDAKLLSLCDSTTFDDIIVLPNLLHLSNYRIDSCLLLLDRLDDFMVVIFLENFPSIVCCRVGFDNEWSEIAYGEQLNAHFPKDFIEQVEQIEFGPLFLSGAAAICGSQIIAKLQSKWPLSFCFIWSIEIVEEEERLGLLLSVVGDPDGTDRESHSPINAYLLESCGEILCLYFLTKSLAFEVYKMDFDCMDFERVKNVRDRAFFVGERYCQSCPLSGPGRIYFTYGNTDNLYCFYTHDDSIMASPLPCPLLSSPIWIIPRLMFSSFCIVMTYDMPLRWEDNYCNEGINISKQGRISTSEFDENGEDGNRLFDLPLDMFEQVSKHLVAFDYLNFRAVSKIFRSVAPPVSWRRSLSAGSGAYNFSSPFLMFADRDESVYKFVDPNINSSSYNYYVMRIPESLQNQSAICYSQLGWLLLLEPLRAVHLYNPFTQDIISYIRSYGKGVEESTFFYTKLSAITTDNGDCSIISVGFFEKTKIMVKVIDLHHGDENVRDIDVVSDKVFMARALTSPTLFNNAFFYLDQEGRLGKLEIDLSAGDNMSWEVLDKPQCPDGRLDSLYQNYLVECGGELISVFLGHLGKWVSVYKLNSNEEAWERVTDLGDYDLYLSPSSSLSVLATTIGGGNRIYCPWLRGSEIVFFSLDTGKWHFSGSGDSSCDLYGTRMQLNSCWIKPTW